MNILHFRTLISLRPVGQSWSNFMCSITGGGERLHNVLRQIGSKLWWPWQQKASIDLPWGKWCLHLFSVAFGSILFILAGNEDRLVPSFSIESSSKLLVTRTGIKAQLSSILGQIRPLILELLALEWQKFHTFEREYLWSQLANLDQIVCVASLGWGKGCIRFWQIGSKLWFSWQQKPPIDL